MPVIRVYVFQGVGEQVPQQYDVDATVYRDVIVELVKYGLRPGYMYGLNGETIIAKDPVTLTAVNYIIPDPPTMTVHVISLFDKSFTIEYPVSAPAAYIMTQVRLQLPIVNKLVVHGERLDLVRPAYLYNLTPNIKIFAA